MAKKKAAVRRAPPGGKRAAPSTLPVAGPASAADPRPPFSVWAYFCLAWLLGGWLAFDGLRQRLTGDFTRLNGQLGPWANLVRGLGLEPLSLGFFFVVLGLTFVASSFGVYLRQRWGLTVGLAVSVIGLFYLGFGTPLAVLCLAALLAAPTRAYVNSRYIRQ